MIINTTPCTDTDEMEFLGADTSQCLSIDEAFFGSSD
jgi:hypothetical protein